MQIEIGTMPGKKKAHRNRSVVNFMLAQKRFLSRKLKHLPDFWKNTNII